MRQRVRELAARGYAAGEASVDCVLLFIPNEQLYAFVHEHDPVLVDDALRQRIVLCSPLTLFAVLAVVRQAVDNFVVERTSAEILGLLGAFEKQWEAFVRQFDLVGQRLDAAHRAFDGLATTRRRQLERPLGRLADLRRQRGLAPADDDSGPACDLVQITPL